MASLTPERLHHEIKTRAPSLHLLIRRLLPGEISCCTHCVRSFTVPTVSDRSLYSLCQPFTVPTVSSHSLYLLCQIIYCTHCVRPFTVSTVLGHSLYLGVTGQGLRTFLNTDPFSAPSSYNQGGRNVVFISPPPPVGNSCNIETEVALVAALLAANTRGQNSWQTRNTIWLINNGVSFKVSEDASAVNPSSSHYSHLLPLQS